MKTAPTDRRRLSFAVLGGVLLTLAFPNIGFGWLAWVALVPLLSALRNVSLRDGLRLGFVAGLAHFLTLMYWLAYTMRAYGNLPLYLATVVLCLLAAYLAVYVALFAAALTRLCPRPGHLAVWAPVFWTALEYLRATLFTGLPWELLGYTQYRVLPLVQTADLFGVYGLTFLIVLTNVAVYLGLLHLFRGDWYGRPVGPRLAAAALLTAAMALLAGWLYGTQRLAAVDRHIAAAPRVPVAVVQGNIDQAVKWDPVFQIATTNIYNALSLATRDAKPGLVVWPETATPFYLTANPRLAAVVRETVAATGAPFLIGSPSFASRDERIVYHNSAYLLASDGEITGRYDKVHLVPFGEYVPLKRWLPFLGKIVAQVGDFSPGTRGETLSLDTLRLGVQICYEVIFPDLARAMTRNGADLLINLTNDAWFGRTAAPSQHFSMAVFRAVENRRALVRAANTGISGYIDPAGRILERSGLFERKSMVHDVPIATLPSLYSRRGDWLAAACVTLALTAAAWHVSCLRLRFFRLRRRRQR